jgi:hypothetical protein
MNDIEKLDAVFISDLHLHPDDIEIKARFDAFIQWVSKKTKTLYILGDFFMLGLEMMLLTIGVEALHCNYIH